MKHNLMKKIVNDLSSGKRGKAGGSILCGLGAVIVFGTVCALLLSAGTVDSRDRETAAPGSVAIDHSYETEVNGFAVTVHVEGVGSCRTADEAGPEALELPGGNDPAAYTDGERQILLASLQDPVVPQPEGGAETDEPSTDETESGTGSREPQIECHVEKVTEGEGYEAMIAQLAEEVGETDAPTQVMELTASVDGTKLDLSGCQITVQAVPTRELMEAVGDGGMPGMMSMTVLPLGGEPVEQLFTSGEMENSDSLPAVMATYTVPDDTSVVYAVRSRSVDHLVLKENTTWELWMDAYDGVDMVIDLNGHSLSVERPVGAWYERSPLFYVYSGGSLTIMDSVGGGSIDVSGLQSIVTTIDDDLGLEEPIVNIKGGLLQNVVGEHVIMANGDTQRVTVNVSGGVLTGANASWIGGGIYAAEGTVNILGGEIKGNYASSYGGGVYARKVEISGGEISGNKVTSGYCYGGGVWAKQVIMHAGRITGNESCCGGGGVYAVSMLMTGGEISENKVLATDGTPYPDGLRGGGGIYIAASDPKDAIAPVLSDEKENYNMSVTGGTIRDNISDHAGGGIFVNVGAVVHIRGMNGGTVRIEGNEARDCYYEYNKVYAKGEPHGHGFAGGGIFVEHPDDQHTDEGSQESNAKRGGRVYIYNAVITENTAQHGGGVAGCGSSSVEICSVDGVAVYNNYVSPTGSAAENQRFQSSVDLYTDGSGNVDSMMMGGVQAGWEGLAVGANNDEKVAFHEGAKEFQNGFYLKAVGLTPAKIEEIKKYATVYIQGNISGSGGGGVGGNGFIKLGLKAPDNHSSSLELQKIVNDAENSDPTDRFQFTITLKDSEQRPLQGSFSYCTGRIDKEEKREETFMLDENGVYTMELGDKEYIRIQNLPPGTRYTIREQRIDGYLLPQIKTNTGSAPEEDGYGVSGWIGTDNQVIFTNTAFYELPSTGGMTPVLYDLLGCALLAAAAGLIYKKRVGKERCFR